MEVLKLLWHVPTVMITMLAAGLIMGQRHVGELSVFDLLTGIAIGAVAGAGIVDLEVPHLPVLLSIMGLALFHWVVTVIIKKWLPFGRLTTFDPAIVVKDGAPLRETMARVRLTLSDLLPLLREKDIFDIREVKYAILEPDGQVTVVKKGTPPPPQQLTTAVIIDGHVEERVLLSMGWDITRLYAELKKQGHPDPAEVFLATINEAGELYVVPRGGPGHSPMIRH